MHARLQALLEDLAGNAHARTQHCADAAGKALHLRMMAMQP